ncbi:toxin-antitoxin system YwqK family antitoxin [Dysgonomonas sp. OttesenSCG-928-M03]|nr:toxin-antitoxin system YwqK family antitoxin [Dysgonomonas sp. OttesenSCG-928-M03]
MKTVKVSLLFCLIIGLFKPASIDAQEAIARSVIKTDTGSGNKEVHSKSGQRLDGYYKILHNDNSYQLANFKDGLLNGPYKDCTKKDVVLREGTFSNGEKDGEWSIYYNSGVLERKEVYRKGKAEGVWSFHKGMNPKPSREVVYKNDEMIEERLYHYGGSLGRTGYFKDELKTGEWKEYFESGKIFEITNYSANQKNGLYERYYPNGQLRQKGTYKNDKLAGNWIFYFENGKTDTKITTTPSGSYDYEIFFQNGNMKEKGTALDERMRRYDKTLYKYYENGQLQSETLYDKGDKISSKEYYNNGTIKEVATYKKDRPIGIYEVYYENGQLKESTTYDSEKLNSGYTGYVKNGLYKSFYENGLLKEEGMYQSDEKDGIWKSLKSDGQPYFIEKYKNGQLIENVSKEEYPKYLK